MSFPAKSQGRNSNLWVHLLQRYQHSASMAHFGTKSLAWGVRCSASNVIKPCAWSTSWNGQVTHTCLKTVRTNKHTHAHKQKTHRNTHTQNNTTLSQHNKIEQNSTQNANNTHTTHHNTHLWLSSLHTSVGIQWTYSILFASVAQPRMGRSPNIFKYCWPHMAKFLATMGSTTCQYHVWSQCPITFPWMARRLKDMDLFGILELATKPYPWTTGFLVSFLTEAGGKIPKLLHVQHMLLSTIWCWISKDLLDD